MEERESLPHLRTVLAVMAIGDRGAHGGDEMTAVAAAAVVGGSGCGFHGREKRRVERGEAVWGDEFSRESPPIFGRRCFVDTNPPGAPLSRDGGKTGCRRWPCGGVGWDGHDGEVYRRGLVGLTAPASGGGGGGGGSVGGAVPCRAGPLLSANRGGEIVLFRPPSRARCCRCCCRCCCSAAAWRDATRGVPVPPPCPSPVTAHHGRYDRRAAGGLASVFPAVRCSAFGDAASR